MVQMPSGAPVATLAIGRPGAVNAALLAAQILGGRHREAVEAYRDERAAKILAEGDPRG
jgi:5-(carboxyamino)imidazole ribonucleotide mutase